MKSTERVQHHARSREAGMDGCAPPLEASLGIDPDGVDEEVWSALVKRVRDGDPDAYRDLHRRLGDFRQSFTRQLFADPEGAYGEFVRELADHIRYGFLRDPHSVLAQARASAMRKTADRVRSLTIAARVLSTLPKRHREVLIRAQLALSSSARLGHDCDATPEHGTRATAR